MCAAVTLHLSCHGPTGALDPRGASSHPASPPAGANILNHNQTRMKARLVSKSAIKAGGLKQNHSATQVCAR
jgi:hypothetical protein